MHQPVVESTQFRRSSFGLDSGLAAIPITGDATQALQDISSRPVLSRRSSVRGAPHTFSPPPPPPPVSTVTQVVDPTSLATLLENIRPASPAADTIRTPRKGRISPNRSALSISPPPRGSLSQSFATPHSASRRAFSFVRDQPFRPLVSGQTAHIVPPERTSSCPPDADGLKNRMMHCNSDGYTSASTSFMTDHSSSPTSSISSQPSDSEDGHGRTPSSRDMKKAPGVYTPSFNLELETRRLDLLWHETEKLWKETHGDMFPRADDMTFRRKVERNDGQSEDTSPESEWRALWRMTHVDWSAFETHWRRDETQKRATALNDDGHFHTVHSESRELPSMDDDKTMNAIMSGFEHRMKEKRRAQTLKRVADESKRHEQGRGSWPGALPIPEQNPIHRAHDRLRPDVTRTRSSSVVVEGRPAFHRARSGSIAGPADLPPASIPPPILPFETAPRAPEKPARVKRSRTSHGSREGFEFLPHEDLPKASPAEEQRASELKQSYIAQAQDTVRAEGTHVNGDAARDTLRPDKPHRRDHERRTSREHLQPGTDLPRPRDVHSPKPDAPLTRVKSTDRVTPIAEAQEANLEIQKLEQERIALDLRIQKLRAATQAAAAVQFIKSDTERGRGREREHKSKATTEPKVMTEARKQQNAEGDVFKAMQDRLRKAEEQKPTEPVRKAKWTATMPGLESGTPNRSPEPRPTSLTPAEPESNESRVHFSSDTPDTEAARPSIPRVRTPGPRPVSGPKPTLSRPRTPSPRSQSPALGSTPSIGSSNATRDTSPGHHAPSSILEVETPEPAPKPQPAPATHPAPRPSAGRPRDSGSSLNPNHDRPKSAATTPGLTVPPHVSISTSPVDGSREQELSPANAKTPRASAFDPDRTPRASAHLAPEASKPEPAPRVYMSPNQARARAEEDGPKRRTEDEAPKRRAEEEASKRRVDSAMGATVAAAAAETFDRAGGKKRSQEAEAQAQEERRVAEERLAKERRRQEDERRRQDEERRRQDEERRARERAEEARLRDAAEKRDREEKARIERERRERQEHEERKRRWAAESTYDRARPPLKSSQSIADAWNSYELRWSALSVASSTQPITFNNIPWPLLSTPTGPESMTPQAVGAFLLSPSHSQDKPRKERLRNAMLRWHSDKFEGRWMTRIDESEQPKVKEAVGAVARSLTELMNKPDLA